MSTKPDAVAQVPIPAIVIVSPVPDGSVTFHDRRTVALLPTVTVDGAAVNEVMFGWGHAFTVTVVSAVLCEPQPDLAIN